ncbi:MAG: ABC transporter ATP-binding protein [Lachnospiraceae bacterium]|nr:ABC transporter ATP-binding protein [Lachnospiraceae bacterium]
MDTIITVDNVYKSFGKDELEVKVLQGADLTVQRGEFVSLMGPSGSGKSTLLYLIGGLDRNYTGDIVVCGENIAKLKEKKLSKLRLSRIGFIFQFYNLVQNLSVEDNIMLPLKVSKRYDAEAEKRLAGILDITGIADKRKAMPARLSGGQQQRVAIARALMGEPEIILADEPTGNLDKESGETIMELFKRINEEKGMTILQVTHSEKNSLYGSRVVNLDNGKLI